VEGHLGDFDAGGGELVQDLAGEVEAGGGGGDGTGVSRPDGLVALAVLGLVGPLDVWRQRHMAETLQVGLDGLGEAQAVAAGLFLVDDLGGQALVEMNHGAGTGAPAGLHQSVPLPLAGFSGQQDLDLPSSRTPAEEARRDHPRVVDHQEVPGAEQLREIADAAVAFRSLAVEDKQAARAARRGMLGDPVGRQLVVEVAGQHGAPVIRHSSGAAGPSR
jgi:hypothetical protein